MIELTEYQKNLLRENSKISLSIWGFTILCWLGVILALVGNYYHQAEWVENLGYFYLLFYVVLEWVAIAIVSLVTFATWIWIKTNKVVSENPEVLGDENVVNKRKEAGKSLFKVLAKLIAPVDTSRKVFYYCYHAFDRAIDVAAFMYMVFAGYAVLALFHGVAVVIQIALRRHLRRKAVVFVKNLVPEEEGPQESIDELCDKLFNAKEEV